MTGLRLEGIRNPFFGGGIGIVQQSLLVLFFERKTQIEKPTTNRKVDTQKPQTMAACGVGRDNDERDEGSLFSKNGWGGRIRTHEWLDQNQLPYHLATPQDAS